MRRNRETGIERGGIALAEAALHLMRTAPPACLVAYYFGSIPFVMTLLYYWADMSYSADAYLHCAPGALLVAIAFVWMKAWQTVYARGLLAFVREETAPRWTLGRIMRMTAAQALVHALGFIIVVPSLMLVLPFLYVHGLLQNWTILGDGEHAGLRGLAEDSWERAKHWPLQSFFVIWLLSPMLVVIGLIVYLALMPILTTTVPELWTGVYGMLVQLPLLLLCPLGFAVTINLEIVVALIPQLARIFLGIQSTSLQTGLMYDSTLMSAVIGGITYLLMDPLVKAAYVLRCFYSESLETGADLRVALRRIVRAGCVVFVAGLGFFFAAEWACAQEVPAPEAAPSAAPSVDAQELDRAIGETLEKDIYRWRMPRVKPEDSERDAALGVFERVIQDMSKRVLEMLRTVAEAVVKLIQWLIPDEPPRIGGSFGWLGGARFLLTALLIALLAALVFLLGVLLVRSRRTANEKEAEAVAVEVDIEDEGISAADLPESGWLAMAREFLEKDEPRLALRALFLAGLAVLGRTHFIRLARGKSNREYQRELSRRGHVTPGLLDVFSNNMLLFESVWYGTRPVTSFEVRQFAENQDRLRHYVEPE